MTSKMGKNIIILGAGFGGLTAANILRKNLPEGHRITVIDKNEYFMMGLVNLWILSGFRTLKDSRVALNKLENKGIKFLNDEIISININANSSVTTKIYHKLDYDYLIVALGAELAPEKINGFVDGDGMCFNLYDSEQIPRLREKIFSIKKGRIAICIADIPYKCPPAPYEASLLINDMLVKNGTRDYVDIDFYTPPSMSLPVAGPKISQDIVTLLNSRGINFHESHKIRSLLSNKQNIIEFDNGNRAKYDVLIVIPPHKVPDVIRNSDLIRQKQKQKNWIEVDKFTLKTDFKNVYAIGDVTDIKVNETASIPKAGIFAEGEARTVSQQIIKEITDNRSSTPKFDGKGYCFMEVGDKKAGYIDVDFYNDDGPKTLLEPPSEDSYKKKIDFERSRVNDWLLL